MVWRGVLLLAAVCSSVSSHGRLEQPPSRSSAWRFGFPTKPDYDDDGANCGGFSNQWIVNKGLCGICGDAYELPSPRPHELGGSWGDGLIVATYEHGAIFTVSIYLTTSHLGYWEMKLCPDPKSNEQKCFDEHLLELTNGETRFYPRDGTKVYTMDYRLPSGLVCEHCVLQWRYVAGNNWGVCNNGTQGLGCGNQENFGACADITIRLPEAKTYSDEISEVSDDYGEIPYALSFYLRHGYFEKQQVKQSIE